MLGHSESYSANHNRPTGISSVACKPPTTIPLVTKSSMEEEAQRKEEKLKRLKDIYKDKEYLIKVKTQEQKKYISI